MADIFKMPKLGETVTTGTVTRWLRAVGDPVGFDDPLLEVATDKVDSEIPSPYSGVLLEIMVPEGETVAVGAGLARIGSPPNPRKPSAPETTSPPSVTSRQSARPSVPSVRPGTAGPCCRRSSGKLAARHGVDLAHCPGLRRRRADHAARTSRPPSPGPPVPPAKPLESPPRQPPQPLPPAAVTIGPRRTRDEVQPLSRMRLAIAERMIESLRIAPHVWTSVEVDMQAVEEVRRQPQGAVPARGGHLAHLPRLRRPRRLRRAARVPRRSTPRSTCRPRPASCTTTSTSGSRSTSASRAWWSR